MHDTWVSPLDWLDSYVSLRNDAEWAGGSAPSDDRRSLVIVPVKRSKPVSEEPRRPKALWNGGRRSRSCERRSTQEKTYWYQGREVECSVLLRSDSLPPRPKPKWPRASRKRDRGQQQKKVPAERFERERQGERGSGAPSRHHLTGGAGSKAGPRQIRQKQQRRRGDPRRRPAYHPPPHWDESSIAMCGALPFAARAPTAPRTPSATAELPWAATDELPWAVAELPWALPLPGADALQYDPSGEWYDRHCHAAPYPQEFSQCQELSRYQTW